MLELDSTEAAALQQTALMRLPEADEERPCLVHRQKVAMLVAPRQM